MTCHGNSGMIDGLGGRQMKISRDKHTKFWVLSSGSKVLYKGRRSPWDHPEIIREALTQDPEIKQKAAG
jgi:hypothetical protein